MVYQILEVVGTSEEGVDQAIHNALLVGEKLYGKLAWYEVTSTNDFSKSKQASRFQAHVRIGCTTH